MGKIAGEITLQFTKDIDGNSDAEILEKAQVILDELRFNGVDIKLKDQDESESVDVFHWNISVDGIVED